MANKPELSIKVNVDPQVDRNKFETDLNKFFPPNNPVKINAAIDAEKALKSISEYQLKNSYDVPIVGKISNVDSMLDVFKGKTFDIELSATSTSLDHVKDQLQNTIDSLDFSNIKLGKTKKTAIPVNVDPTIAQTDIDALKTKIETGIGTINISADVTQATVDSIKKKFETALNKIKFKPQIQNPGGNPGGGGGGGGSKDPQGAKIRELGRNLVEQARVRNKQDDSVRGKRYRAADTNNSRAIDLQLEELDIRSDLSKLNPNYKNTPDYEKAVKKSNYIRDEYTSNQADKKDLDIVKELNAELKNNLKLRKELNKIDKQSEPIKYANQEKRIKDSNNKIGYLGAQAKKTGASLSGIRNSNTARLAEIQEEYNNQLLDDYEKAVEDLRKAGAKSVAAVGKTDRASTVDIPNEYKAAYGRVYDLDYELANNGLTNTKRYYDLQQKGIRIVNDVTDAIQGQKDAQLELNAVNDNAVKTIGQVLSKLEGYKRNFESSDTGINSQDYAFTSEWASRVSVLYDSLENNQGGDKNQVAQDWAKKYNITGVNSLADAYQRIQKEANKADIAVRKFTDTATKERADIQANIQISNLQSQLHDYVEKYPKVLKKLELNVKNLDEALSEPGSYKKGKNLSLQMAELRSQAKAMGLESENLIDKFEKLFGQHLSTMITMAALHKMQDAMKIIYQNVVEIDTAMTELRKVTNLTAAEYEKFINRSADQAQKLGASISEIINSTADWSRLGYNEKDAENLATYSILLKNVGDGINDVNTSSSYLISTLQGFGLLAKDAEDVVNKIDAVANTQPVTANDIGEILTRSSAAMAAANNTLEETIALGTAANAVIQDADTVGRYMPTLFSNRQLEKIAISVKIQKWTRPSKDLA